MVGGDVINRVSGGCARVDDDRAHGDAVHVCLNAEVEVCLRSRDGGLFVARFFADGSAGLGIDQMDLAAGVAAYGLERVVVRLGGVVGDPALDLQAGRRTAEQECGHRSKTHEALKGGN